MLNTLNVAQSGLGLAQVQVENVMNNIANENTVGYKKRVVAANESGHDDGRLTGRGVTVSSVDRVTNIYVYDKLIKEQSKTSQHSELASMLADIESIFFETDDSGLSNDLDKYFQAIENLRANPSNHIYRSTLSNYGQIVVDDLKTLYTNIEDRERITINQLNDDVDSINGLLRDIGSVNKKIIDSADASNALHDKRDLLESKISKFVPVKVDRTDGYILSIGDITAIRYDSNVHDLKIKTDYINQKDVYAKDLPLLNNVSTLVDQATWSGTDSITYYYDKDSSVTVTAGDNFTDTDGLVQVVTATNLVQAISAKINNDPELSNFIEAHNGQYHLDSDGNKIELTPQTNDYYLIVESKVTGLDGKFEGRIIVNDDNNLNADGNQVSNMVAKNDLKSKLATNDVHLEIFENELSVKTGRLKSMLDNVDTTSEDNKFKKYKDKLDNFAKALGDFTHGYIDNGNQHYISGQESSLLNEDKLNMNVINLFDGATVKTLEFKQAIVGSLTQDDLDYLATMQWNEHVNIHEGTTDNTSFNKFFEALRVDISADKENIDYLHETQVSVTKSLQLNYDKLVKVNKDDEMINLIKFQSAYEANAKLITIVDEMLATILGMRR